VAKRGTLNHPKNQRLAKALKVGPGVTLGLLETIWEWASIYKSVGQLSFSDMEEALDYGKWRLTFKDYARVVDALSDPKHCWLDPLDDGSFFIHDWPDHANDSVHAKLYREVKTFANGVRPLPKKIGKREKPKLAELWAKLDGAACQRQPLADSGMPPGAPTLPLPSLPSPPAPSGAAFGQPLRESVFLGREGDEVGSDPLQGIPPQFKAEAIAVMERYVARRFGINATIPASYDRMRDLRDAASTLEAHPGVAFGKFRNYFDRPTLARNAPLFKIVLALGLGVDAPAGRRNHDPPPPNIDIKDAASYRTPSLQAKTA
jgi:hypothetical protein